MPAASIQSISSAFRKEMRPPDLKHQPLQVLRGGLERFQQGRQARGQVAGLPAFHLVLGPLEGFLEAFPVEGLQQVIEGVHLEGAQGVVVVGGASVHSAQHGEAVHLGHLHVEEQQVRRVLLDGGHSLAPIGALADNLDVAVGGEQRQPAKISNPLTQRRRQMPAMVCSSSALFHHQARCKPTSAARQQRMYNRAGVERME